jgi:hypothetical protein
MVPEKTRNASIHSIDQCDNAIKFHENLNFLLFSGRLA